MPSSVELPADLIAKVLDFLPVPDLCRVARVSLLFKDIVYDERRWVTKLKAIGVWSDEAAQQHFEEETFRRQQRINGKKAVKLKDSPPVPGNAEVPTRRSSEVDASLPQKRHSDLLQFTPKRETFATEAPNLELLNVLHHVRSIRGKARHEFAKVWKALYPLYEDIVLADSPASSIVFRRFREPEEQAMMLRQLVLFGESRAFSDWKGKNAKLFETVELFESAAVREFEIAYDNRDEASMKRYAGVLDVLNGGEACVMAFCRKNVLFTNPSPNPFECFDTFSEETDINLGPMGEMTDGLALELLSQKELISRIFGDSHDAWNVLVGQVFSTLLTDYVNKLVEYAQQQGSHAYLLALTGSYQHLYSLAVRLSQHAKPDSVSTFETIHGVPKKLDKDPPAAPPDAVLSTILQQMYEEHVSYYLEEELASLRSSVDREVLNWDKQIKDESLQTEQLFLSGVNREVAKKNFLQSFTKVILMPVNVVGSVMPFPGRPPTINDQNQPPALVAANNEGAVEKPDLPTTELAARAAIMNSGLARIKRLLSLEVALQLIHTCKESIDRARSFVTFSGRVGEEAREACETMFGVMLQALGGRHIQVGFDLALESLKTFNPRHNQQVGQVQPLVDFLELVHVGDLMQQMVDVFYNTELCGGVGRSIVDRSDFLSPAVKDKKRFEMSIDERVAEGLNRGIDVLVEQVDYLLVTTQKPTDFKPWVVLGGTDDHLDLSATPTAVSVVQCLQTHTDLLRGSTDKATLDVFFQEVGVRFFGSLCKHLKRQSVTVEGGLKLISDLNHYAAYVASLKQPSIAPFFAALKELGNIYIISGRDGKAVGQVISDIARFGGVLRPEDVYEFAERRADWQKVKKHVDRVIYGTKFTEDCVIS